MSRLHLDAGDREAVGQYLSARGWLAPDEAVRGVEPAGAGNMNLVLRVRTDRRSVVVKQGRPWVEKYPDIPAPTGRTLLESDWYALAGRVPELAERMPEVYGADTRDEVLCLQDLGDRGDLTWMYRQRPLPAGQLESLLDWLARLHHAFAWHEEARALTNRAMRELNHEHIFAVPLRAGEGPDLEALTPGLAHLAARLRADDAFAGEVARLGERYLGPGSTLVHGDFFPGSWLAAGDEPPWVIDPEFGFFGPPEWDVGVLLAHLALAGQPPELTDAVRRGYAAPPGFEWPVADGFAGVEITRRLLGVAQLPLSTDLDGKAALLEHARGLVVA